MVALPPVPSGKSLTDISIPTDLLEQVREADLMFWGGPPRSNSGLIFVALRNELKRLNDINKLLNERNDYNYILWLDEKGRRRQAAVRTSYGESELALQLREQLEGEGQLHD